jgi:hypothetical protein
MVKYTDKDLQCFPAPLVKTGKRYCIGIGVTHSDMTLLPLLFILRSFMGTIRSHIFTLYARAYVCVYVCYNARGGILSADVARACAWRVGPSRFD